MILHIRGKILDRMGRHNYNAVFNGNTERIISMHGSTRSKLSNNNFSVTFFTINDILTNKLNGLYNSIILIDNSVWRELTFTNTKKPTLGIKPIELWVESRIKDLVDAMKRAADNDDFTMITKYSLEIQKLNEGFIYE